MCSPLEDLAPPQVPARAEGTALLRGLPSLRLRFILKYLVLSSTKPA